jgi:drug/metabolite transporter (DMT)-like permease
VKQISLGSSKYRLAKGGVLLASLCFGLVPFFARGLTDQGFAPYAVAFFRYVITALVLMPLLVRQWDRWKEVLWGMSAGAAMGLGWIGYVAAITIAPASTVGVIYMTYPVFTILLSWLVFGEKATKQAWYASAVILLAATIAGHPQVVQVEQMSALLLALAAPMGFGFGICVVVNKLQDLRPLARVAAVCLGATLALCPLMLTSNPEAVIPQAFVEWALVFGLAVGTALVPQLIYSISAPLIGASRTAAIGSIELPTMFAVGVFAFGESLKISQALACFLILIAILLSNNGTERDCSGGG